VDMISEGGEGSKKENDIAKWKGKIGKSPTLSKLFTKVPSKIFNNYGTKNII